ncbi:phage tail tip lysozyme [Chenggangzhangella methanolivorans]|uniref:Phage tail lysozyme domain-containing protein n=1 Tax=Chenggangzhangella methanolivorans TaxID=1437009 RepID=A0A9E6RAI2_9HYPH|nr:phage tail tip lysozyme [Chenggangzhangella methanolivorans]QZN99798.1 hypothetical protein K6K41_24565 [Chenggangzhangella methanolivorans]
MAERSGGSVVIRLAVRDGEVVRRALQDIGTDGQRALKALDDASRAPTRGALALSEAVNEAKSSIEGLATSSGSLGPALTFLRNLGPAGLAAGVAVAAGAAAVVAGVGKAKQALDSFGATVDAANSIGLSTDIYQGIAASALLAGVNAEEATGAPEVLVASGQAAAGQGDLYDKLSQYNSEAAEAIRNATTQEERVRILAKALSEAANAEERNAIAVAAFGRSGVALGRAFAEAGGNVDRMVASARELGLIVPREVLARAEELGDRLDVASQIIDTQLKQAALDLAPLMADLAEKAADFARYLAQGYGFIRDGTPNVRAQADAMAKGVDDPVARAAEAVAATSARIREAEAAGNADVAATQRKVLADQQAELERLQEAQRERNRAMGMNRGGADPASAEAGSQVPFPRSAPTPTEAEEQRGAAARERRLKEAERLGREAAQARAELGDVSGLVEIKKRELDALVERGLLSSEAAAQALDKYRQAQEKAAAADGDREAALRKAEQIEREAAQVRADLGDVSGLVAIKQKELNELVEKGAISQATATAALVKYREQVERTNESRVAKSSAFSGLARLSAEGTDLRGIYDDGATDLIKGLTDDLMKLDEAGGSVGSTLKSMGATIEEMVKRMIMARFVAKPLADGLTQIGDRLFGPAPGSSPAPAGAVALRGPGGIVRAPLAPVAGGPAIGSGDYDGFASRFMADAQRDFPGLTRAGAAGFAGNFGTETGGLRYAQEISPRGGRGGLGWAQWTGDRRVAFEKWMAENGHKDASSYDANYGFWRHEMRNTGEGRVMGSLAGVEDPRAAADIVRREYERPGVINAGSRAGYADRAFQAPKLDVSQLEQSFNALTTTTKSAAAQIPAMTQGATAAGPALGGVAQQAGGLGGVFQSLLGGIGNVFTGGGNMLSGLLGFNPFGFESGGYTGSGSRKGIAGVVHGQEFVSHAAATRRWRPMLEAMNRGEEPRAAGGGEASVSVNVGAPPGTRVEERRDGRGGRSFDVILDERSADALSRPGSATSKALQSNYGARPMIKKLG